MKKIILTLIAAVGLVAGAAHAAGGDTIAWDKAPNKFGDWNAADYQAAGFRSVPGAIVRRGAYVGKNVVLMPVSYTHLRAHET